MKTKETKLIVENWRATLQGKTILDEGIFRDFLREMPPTAALLNLFADKRHPKEITLEWVKEFKSNIWKKLYNLKGKIEYQELKELADSSRKDLSDKFLNIAEDRLKGLHIYNKASRDVLRKDFMKFVCNNQNHERDLNESYQSLKRELQSIEVGSRITFDFFPPDGYLEVLDAESMTFNWCKGGLIKRFFNYQDYSLLKDAKLKVRVEYENNLRMPAHIKIFVNENIAHTIFNPEFLKIKSELSDEI